VNFAVLSTEVAQSFPTELVGNFAHKVEKTTAKKAAQPVKRGKKEQQAAFPLPLHYFVAKAGINCCVAGFADGAANRDWPLPLLLIAARKSGQLLHFAILPLFLA
jgi:hypothetical protein